ncbi:RbsD/FucU domain-containing protein [Aurantimonas sp. 22II-16-19i]|uniref:RbsD/FucU family protein n=1 Tax=Aurantimonas sp. 22II-16-19i TaxID=1317114 RepID=UPI0009F7D3DC|nr:RbsD/FucU domain-containing protein [Aurantimonas sp. 22II-16-19i]ORE92303.1 transport protein RbsD/FucU [Aurantimonas sp. 22II-16-19i]
MLKTIPPLVTPELLQILAAMGHGDELVLVDRNFPAASVAAETVTGVLVQLSGVGTNEAATAILSLLPLDSFVEAPLRYMAPEGEPEADFEVHRDMQAIADAAEGRAVVMEAVERFDFYEEAKGAHAVVRTGESRPYGCFIFKKGVIFD